MIFKDKNIDKTCQNVWFCIMSFSVTLNCQHSFYIYFINLHVYQTLRIKGFSLEVETTIFHCLYTAWSKVLGQQKFQYRHNIRLVTYYRPFKLLSNDYKFPAIFID